MSPSKKLPKATPKVESKLVKKVAPKNTTDRVSKVNKTTDTRPRTKTLPNMMATPAKENKNAASSNGSRSVKKPSWMRRPKPAHSGVPVPEKLRKLLQKELRDSLDEKEHDCSL